MPQTEPFTIPFLAIALLFFFCVQVAAKQNVDCSSWPVYLHNVMTTHVGEMPVLVSACLAVARLLSVRPDLQALIGDPLEEQIAERKLSQEQDRRAVRRFQTAGVESAIPIHHDVVKAINLHGTSPGGASVALAACRATYWLSEDNPRLRKLLLMKGIHLSIVSCLEVVNDELFYLWGLRALRELSKGTHQSNCNEVYNSGALGVALKAMDNFQERASIQAEAIGLLACLCYVEVLPIGVSGASVLQGRGGQYAVWKFCDNDFHVKLLRAMQQHVLSPTVQEMGLEGLSAIAELTTLLEQLINYHAVDTVLASMDAHVEDEGIQYKGCMLLRLLACKDLFGDESDEEAPEVKSVLDMNTSSNNASSAESTPYTLVRAKQFDKDQRSEHSTSSLASASEGSDSEIESPDCGFLHTSFIALNNHQRCVEASRLITQAMRTFSENETILTEGCVAMVELASLSSLMKEAFVKQAGHVVLFNILRKEDICQVGPVCYHFCFLRRHCHCYCSKREFAPVGTIPSLLFFSDKDKN